MSGKTTIHIKKTYYEKPYAEIENQLNNLTDFYNKSYITMQYDVVRKIEQLIQILTQILVDKLTAFITPEQNDESVEINYNPTIKLILTQKMDSAKQYGNEKRNDWESLLGIEASLSSSYLKDFSVWALRRYCKEANLEGYSTKSKKALITMIMNNNTIIDI